MFTPAKPDFHPLANPLAVLTSGNVRFTILKSRLIRIEYAPNGQFEDRPSQVFWHREQALPEFSARQTDEWLIIETEHLHLRYKAGEELNYRYLQITLKETGITWHYGDPDHTNLGGTARTLDRANGRIPLGQGLVSRSGWSVVDDTGSLVIDPEGTLTSRNAVEGYRDIYFFGYAQDYLSAIREYQHIAGRPGLIPRWALGNWWSRYWAYTQEELTQLMLDFQERCIPLSVCIVDMDWHITNTGNNSSGWTGYTWNKELFPDPAAFLAFLHTNKLKTALNLHPAEGVHPHEAQYESMARAVGIDPATKEPVPFDITSDQFTRAYLEILHHPYEQQGVDFWWIDWQQGTRTKKEGLDPLYALNELHYYDLGRNPEKRPFIFSRWPGLGGHRYPIGFSGDSVVSWESLQFQPEFTATAANVAFGWWSHDIGGHCDGIEEAELFLRWVQYGVFSPILRIHSTNNPYIDRRPWKFGADAFESIRKSMQLRHALVPLLYSANHRSAEDGEPLVLPVYYEAPSESAAYRCPQEYLFCRQLLAAPFTQKVNPDTRLARQVVWLPEGDWYHFFTGEYVQGGFWYPIYGGKEDIPVFAKAGAIIPLNGDEPGNGVSLPKTMRLKCFPGKDAQFELYEDDGETQQYLEGACAQTIITQETLPDEICLKIGPALGRFPGMPETRAWILEFENITAPENILIHSEDELIGFESQYDTPAHRLTISLEEIPTAQKIVVQLSGAAPARQSSGVQDHLESFLRAARLPTSVKWMFSKRIADFLEHPKRLLEIWQYFSPAQTLAVLELIFGKQKDPIASDPDTALMDALNAAQKWIASRD
ncbi:MAG TPA: glycoside hydrolase family 31 protein [Anaerolineaceae bacterium]|nr:glycoside hydrolase family 31 protein [Anaerolineaceae bacterium]